MLWVSELFHKSRTKEVLSLCRSEVELEIDLSRTTAQLDQSVKRRSVIENPTSSSSPSLMERPDVPVKSPSWSAFPLYNIALPPRLEPLLSNRHSKWPCDWPKPL